MGFIQSTFLRNPDKSSQLVAAQTSSFTPTFTPANELIRDLEDDDQGDALEIDQNIDNLFDCIESNDPIHPQLEVKNPISTEGIPTTQVTSSHSSPPSPPPTSEPLPNPEPPSSPPLEAQTNTGPNHVIR